MEKQNVQIDLDQNIVAFVADKNIEENILHIVSEILKEQKIKANHIFVSIQSMTTDEIQAINKEYRGIDKPTDVLSFPIFDREDWQRMREDIEQNKEIQAIELGDIILCLDIVKAQAEEYGTGLKRETLYMITHGMCHLLGFDHEIESEKIEMRALEEKILERIGVSR